MKKLVLSLIFLSPYSINASEVEDQQKQGSQPPPIRKSLSSPDLHFSAEQANQYMRKRARAAMVGFKLCTLKPPTETKSD